MRCLWGGGGGYAQACHALRSCCGIDVVGAVGDLESHDAMRMDLSLVVR